MKKVFLSSIVLMFAALVSAATYTWENVVTLKLTDGNSDTYTSRFGEAPELTDEASWGAAVANLEGATVRAYTVLNGVNYEKLYLQDMTNTALVVKTYESTSLSFELKANYGIVTLFDKLTGATKTVDKAGVAGLETDTYNCTVETNATIENRFILFYNAPTVKLYNEWDDNWATPLNFTNNNNGTFSATKTFTGNGYCPFKIVENGNWLGNGDAFKRDYTSATGINNDGANMTLWVDVPGDYTFTWDFMTNSLSITMPTLPTVQLKGADTFWGQSDDFIVAADGLTASVTKHFGATDFYTFKVLVGADDWRSYGYDPAFTRSHTEQAWIGNEANHMLINADQDGDYTFTWTFVENKLTITFPAASVPTCTTVRTGMNIGQYYTLCLPKAVTAANGASFWNMSNRGEGVAYLVEAELPLVAGRPYIIQAEDAELCVEYSGDEVAAGAFGALHGTLAPMNQAALDAAGSDIYLLKDNELRFVSGQSNNNLPANRAYIKYNELVVSTPSPAPGRRVRAIPMQGQGATGVENLNASEAPIKTVIDGTMYIIRGEHMFDATGRMVK
jgi:hypothetical protein